MTYCVAAATASGLVFCSDSRTNAGPDMLSTYSKMHLFQPDGDRVFCILSAGNLATTQAIISQIELDLEDPNKISLRSCNKMVEAARYVTSVNRNEQLLAEQAASGSGVDTSASLIFGGEIRDGGFALYLIYSAGNFIAATDDTPYLQIGESKYGKPILDRILTPTTSLEDTARCAVVSMDSTIKSNATVGPPIEVLVYEKGSFETNHHIKMEAEDPYLREIKRAWDEVLKAGFANLPRFDWEQRTAPSAPAAFDAPLANTQQQAAQMPPAGNDPNGSQLR